MHVSAKIKPFRQKNRILSLWAVAIAFLTLIVLSRPRIDEAGGLDILLDLCGLLLVLAGISGRLWSILYIGGRKNHELVTTGPYAMTRNPLYFFSVITVCGIGLMFGSAVVAVAATLIAVGIFFYTAKRERIYLAAQFGREYSIYAQATPLFWPWLRPIRSPSELTITIRTLKSTFRDASFIIGLLPVMELLEYLRLEGYLSALFTIP